MKCVVFPPGDRQSGHPEQVYLAEESSDRGRRHGAQIRRQLEAWDALFAADALFNPSYSEHRSVDDSFCDHSDPNVP